LSLGYAALLRDPFGRVAIAVARRELHRGIDAWRVATQNYFTDADGLDKIAPVDRAEKAKAADTVADRHLVRRLLLIRRLHQLFDRQVVFAELLFDPRQGKSQCRALALQTSRQLGHERADHRRRRARHVGDDENQALWVPFGSLHHPVGPGVSQTALGDPGGNPDRYATQVRDQSESQHDRNGPQLAEL